MSLKLSRDRKVSPLSKWTIPTNGKNPQAKPKVANSFGLPALLSCPDYTEWCRNVCYAFSLERFYKGVHSLVNHNLEVLRSCGSNVKKMTDLLTEMVASVNWHDSERVFRWHWDGDIFSRPYAKAIVKTCLAFPDIQFWLYTRSFDYVPDIVNIPNLTVYLSVDRFNQEKAKNLYESLASGTVWIASCADTWDESELIMREVVGRNAPRCPELTHKVPLVTPEGKGACVECGLCIYGRNHVRFASN